MTKNQASQEYLNQAKNKNHVSPTREGDTKNQAIQRYLNQAENKNHVSPTPVGDTKNQAIQRYLNRATNTPCNIEKYNPNGRSTQYYRLKYRLGRKVKTIHIQGGNCSAPLSIYRVDALQSMIDRGAQLPEILKQLADFNSGTS